MMNMNLEEKINTILLNLSVENGKGNAGRAILDEIQREYRIEPIDPDAHFVFPQRDGAVIGLELQDSYDYEAEQTIASREDGNWSILGVFGNKTEEELREAYCNFEVLNDGSK